MTLLEKQELHVRLVAKLIQWATDHGYGLTWGETWRPPEMAAIYAAQHKGIKNSLHTQRLAVDLNLFKNGTFLTTVKDYESIGLYWEGLSGPDWQCTWGGRFGDADHFSIEHEGIK